MIVITIHGIHGKTNNWQVKMRDFIKTKNPKDKVFTYRYGFLLAPFSYWAVLTRKFKIPSFFRKSLISGFTKFIKKIQKEFPDEEISIVAHSFGTWLSYHAIGRDEDIKIDNLVLIHGVISSHVEKLRILNWLELGKLGRVFAWSSPNDEVVKKVALPPFGKVGFRGFVRYDNKEDYEIPARQPYKAYQIYNVQTKEKHSGVLRKLGFYGEEIYDQLMG